jgi:hypothetical protein
MTILRRYSGSNNKNNININNNINSFCSGGSGRGGE